jgi:hypothetical protein
MIGPVDGKGEDSFDVLVCSPQWIARELQTGEYLWGRSTLLIAEYSYETLERAILMLCHRVEGHSWSAVAEKLNRWSSWEFEDYH